MKRIYSLLVMLLVAMTSVFAQADKVVGNYQAVRNGVTSKVKVFKHNGGYRAQVYWVDNLKKEDGSIRIPDALVPYMGTDIIK
mgnify:CR=1 FL=1